MKSIIFFLCTLFLIMNSAYASCQWSYLNQLNKDIKHAQDLLSDYSTCRSNCKGLETGLIGSLSKMSHKSSCGAHIFTASNVETINFISGRFRLIQKQKTSSTWASGVSKKPVRVIAAIPKAPPKVVVIAPKITAKPTFIKPVYKRAPKITLVKAPKAPRAIQQTRMMITKEAYKELWEDDQATVAQRNSQRQVNNQTQLNQKIKQLQINRIARDRHLAQQRLDKHLKQVVIEQEKIQLVKNKRRAMQNHLHKQRLVRQQFLKKRALAIQVNRQKVRQQRLARAQRMRTR